MKIGNTQFDTENKTYVMGILNITPNSFSDGGNWNSLDKALFRTEQMIKEGADIIDVGGESTRPGYTMISESEEIERIVPVIAGIKERFDIPVSADTYKSAVAKKALETGADLINDIWGLKYDKNMAKVISRSGAVCCLMHNREKPEYRDFVKDMINETMEIALNSGIKRDKIILDPGVGFGKTYEQNLMCVKHLHQLCEKGYPVLLGCSRKSLIGNTLDLPVEERLEGTLVTTVMAVLSGCAFVRVHDIKENVRAIKMAEAIMDR